ncbi:hypothetical protein [Novosphingobium sp.]|uniref:hypothetical protein n=1 Tax=Novosphingobium sp. TaxID=1874826 RepID=UPI0031DC07BE
MLVTPLTRRMFRDGRLVNDLAPWADAIRTVAAEMKCALIDLNVDSATAVQAMGQTEADTLAELPRGSTPTDQTPARAQTEVNVLPTAQPRQSFDSTHLGRKGADLFAAMVARELAANVPEMRPLLVVN